MVKQTICSHKQVERYLLNKLTDEEEMLFQQHLSHCEACRDYLMQIRVLASTIGEKEPYRHTKVVKKAFVPFRFQLKQALSAAACLFILVGLSVYWHSNREILYPTSIEYQMRASGGDTQFHLIFPEKDSIQVNSGNPIVFKWEPSTSYHLKIDCHDSTLVEIDGYGSEYTLQDITLTSYPYIHWNLTVERLSYSGHIIFN